MKSLCKNEDAPKIKFITGVSYNNTEFLAAYNMNALFMYDRIQNKLAFLSTLSQDNKLNFLYIKSFLYKNEAWFIPASASSILIVNLDTFKIRYLPLNYKQEFNGGIIKYQNFLIMHNNKVCILPRDVDAAMLIDLESKESEVFYDISDGKNFYYCSYYEDSKIYFIPWTARNILEIDTNLNTRKYISNSPNENLYGEISLDVKNNIIFQGATNANLIKVYNNNDRTENKIIISKGCGIYYGTFYNTNTDNDVFFWPFDGDVILKLNKYNQSVKEYIFNADHSPETLYPIYSDSHIEALSMNYECIIRYDEIKDSFEKILIKTDWNSFFNEIKDAQINITDVIGKVEDMLCESEKDTLSFFVSYISAI